MKNLRLILASIVITALTSSSALAGAQTESGAENALAYLSRELEMTAKHLILTGKTRTTSIPKSAGNPSQTPFLKSLICVHGEPSLR